MEKEENQYATTYQKMLIEYHENGLRYYHLLSDYLSEKYNEENNASRSAEFIFSGLEERKNRRISDAKRRMKEIFQKKSAK